MKRILHLSLAIGLGVFGLVSTSEAQVVIRAPFVRIAVGDGVRVRAPFFNLNVPPSGPVYGPVVGPYYRPYYVPQPIIVGSPLPPLAPAQPVEPFNPPAPQPVPLPPIPDAEAPPQPNQPVQTPTLEAFARSFQPKAGSYEVTLLNPITKQPTTVRFALPEGTPRRVHTTRDSIEFVYALRQWVRIEFDRDGAIVTSR
jgi:hypothetical protein